MALAKTKMMKEIADVFLMQYYVWPGLNFLNFSVVPENLRVLYSNIISVFWNAYLCTRIA